MLFLLQASAHPFEAACRVCGCRHCAFAVLPNSFSNFGSMSITWFFKDAASRAWFSSLRCCPSRLVGLATTQHNKSSSHWSVTCGVCSRMSRAISSLCRGLVLVGSVTAFKEKCLLGAQDAPSRCHTVHQELTGLTCAVLGNLSIALSLTRCRQSCCAAASAMWLLMTKRFSADTADAARKRLGHLEGGTRKPIV